nr:aquaporin [Mucilaginibacter straminoryzae]
MFISEFVGTALLLSVGLSTVIFNWGEGSVMNHYIPDPAIRRLFAGFLFGSTGCLITLSPVGKISGAHINPVVSIAFWLRGKMRFHAMLGFVISQMLGAAAGSLPLLLWGNQGKSIGYGITLPGDGGVAGAIWGEAITTAGLILLLFVMAGTRYRNYTPYTIPFLYSVMVWAEAPFSGCSTNPARSFGPALVSQNFNGYWVYWIGPLIGTLFIVGCFCWSNLKHIFHFKVARLSFHNHPTHPSLKEKQK